MAVPVFMAVPCLGAGASSSSSPSYGAAFDSHTWCFATVDDCYGTDTPFGAHLQVTETSPDTIDVASALITIAWISHYLELLEINTDAVWDTSDVEIEQEDGRATIRLTAVQPEGVRVVPGTELCEYVFSPERPGELPYWVSSIELKDPGDQVVLADTTEGALGGSYRFELGDFTGNVLAGYDYLACPDRDIDVYDLNVFSIHYGLIESDSLFDCRTDIAPTFTGWIHGVPIPDGVIDFADFSIFAEAYTYQLGTRGSGPPVERAGDWESLRAAVVEAMDSGRLDPGKGDRTETVHFTFSPLDTTVTQGDSVWIDVDISGNVEDLKTYQLIIEFNSSLLEIVSVVQGPVFFNTPTETFFRNRSVPDSLDVMDSVLGAGLTVSEAGTILRLQLRALEPGFSFLRFLGRRAAGVDGLPLSRGYTDGVIHILQDPTSTAEVRLPVVTQPRLVASPNPADGTCQLMFSAPEDQPVRVSAIEIYDVRGRLVRQWTLEDESTHSLSVEWDGRDHAGNRMSPGVYFAVVKGGSTRYQTKVILAN
jgi:hypothetical protein